MQAAKDKGGTLVSDAQAAQGFIEPGVALSVVIYLFLFSTLFDPADKMLGLKVPLYVACWICGLFQCVQRRQDLSLPPGLILYMLMMVLLPVMSIALYFLQGGGEPFQGFVMLKAYLFISFAALIYFTRVDLFKLLARLLNLLALSIISLAVFVQVFPEWYLPVYAVGEQWGIFSIDKGRDYGSDVVMFQMYFSTSPMLAVAVAYYFFQATRHPGRWGFWALAVLNVAGLLVAGSRNNILVAFFLPLCLWLLFSRRKALTIAWIVGATFGISVVARNQISAWFDPVEASNFSKILLFDDYFRLLSVPGRFFLGSGLGGYDQWTEKGFNYITELTYLEIFRNFGVPMGVWLIGLLLYPVVYAFFLKRGYSEKYIVLAYVAYLVMSASNPLLFSSMGMMLLGGIMANIFIHEHAGSEGSPTRSTPGVSLSELRRL